MITNLEFTSTDNYTSSIYETYQLEYELFLIEANAFNVLGKINNNILQESSDMFILQESIKETLTVWITRFTEALQKALNNFMGAIEGAQDLTYLKSIEANVKSLNKDPGFTVNNIRNYKEDAIKNFDIVQFQDVYNTKKDSLQTQEQFLIQNYSNYGFAAGQTDIKEVLETALVDVVKEEVPVTIGLIRGYYDWCRNDYVNDMDTVKKMMNKYNESAKAISNLIKSLPEDYSDKEQTVNNPNVTQPNNNQQQPQNASFNFAYLYEADDTTAPNPANATPNPVGNNNKTNNPSKMEFNDKVDYMAKASGNKGASNQEAVNAIKTYLSVTTRIVSTLFMIVKNRKSDYMRVLKHLFPMNKQQREVAQSTVNINATNNTPQVTMPQT